MLFYFCDLFSHFFVLNLYFCEWHAWSSLMADFRPPKLSSYLKHSDTTGSWTWPYFINNELIWWFILILSNPLSLSLYLFLTLHISSHVSLLPVNVFSISFSFCTSSNSTSPRSPCPMQETQATDMCTWHMMMEGRITALVPDLNNPESSVSA